MQKERCCNELTVSWRQQHIYVKGIPLSPTGRYKKQATKGNAKDTYYNSEKDLHLFFRQQNWAVRNSIQIQ